MQNVAETRAYKATYDYSNVLTSGITLTRKSDNATKLLLGFSPNTIFDIVLRLRANQSNQIITENRVATKEEAFDHFCDSEFLNK